MAGRYHRPHLHRVAEQRLTDHARAVFDADYVREHHTHGYATTVHSAPGVTARPRANTTRSMLYVAMTRARDANTVKRPKQLTGVLISLRRPWGCRFRFG